MHQEFKHCNYTTKEYSGKVHWNIPNWVSQHIRISNWSQSDDIKGLRSISMQAMSRMTNALVY